MSTAIAKKTEVGLQGLLDSENIKGRFRDMLGSKAAGFMSSILSAVSSNPALKDADPMSVISASAIAASLDLPINPNLGFAHIVPYGGKAQFQMGWKGFVQLGLRTGQYENINVAIVYEGELERYDKFTGEVILNSDGRTSDKVVGYVAFFKLLNGFRKWHYMTVDEAMSHGKKYSKSFGKDSSQWKQNPDAMCLKTVLKLLLSKFGILSIGMERAIQADQAIIGEDGAFNYPDRRERPDKATEVMKRFEQAETACTENPQTCGLSLGPDNGEYGCEMNGETCPHTKRGS